MEPDHIRYIPATGYGHDFLYTQVTLMPVPQREHILRAANEQRFDAPRVREEPWELQDCLSVVATRHLQGQTGMDAYITGRDGPVIAVATEGNEEIADIADHVLYVPKTLEQLQPILNGVVMQLFAYHVTVAKGLNPDRPRNLAKSVTVE